MSVYQSKTFGPDGPWKWSCDHCLSGSRPMTMYAFREGADAQYRLHLKRKHPVVFAALVAQGAAS